MRGLPREEAKRQQESFQQPPPPVLSPLMPPSSIEAALEKLTQSIASFVQNTHSFMSETRSTLKNQESALRNLENQVGQLAKDLGQLTRSTKTFPSDTVVNPREECKATRVMMVEETQLKEESVETEPKTTMITPSPPPRPKSLIGKPNPLSKFLEVFSCLEVNMPLLRNLREMRAYVHSMKELLLKKRTLKKGDTVVMTKECS
ncbi:hypothetical protein PIB30_106097 [Stylosanthes scabra]|uniref:Uncharacterized protein n=1 Tax=Stylosanthes scabra TaxID=79078 RepID=A0ABU6ZXD9_9FABA|nr:hypothetical protein [Stylosanthes scabra]